MKRTTLLLVAALFAASITYGQDPFVEQDGLLVFEMESIPIAGSYWTSAQSWNGFTGTSYYLCDKATISSPNGVMEVKIFINNPGTYFFNLRNRHDHADKTEENDCFTKMDNGSWVKTFSHTRGEWTWDTGHDDHVKFTQPPRYNLSAGEHTFYIAARSSGFAIDRVHFYTSSVNSPLSTSHPESERASTVAKPSISPNGGTIYGATEVTLSTTTSGAEIRYTLNGNDPTSSSTLYSSKFTIDQTTTVKAKAFLSGKDPSTVASATFTLEQLPDWQIPVNDVTASSNDGNIPSNSIDNDLSTRWSADGDGEWIQFDFGSTVQVQQISIAFYLGDQRSSSFDLEVSNDGSTWTTVGSFEGSGTTLDPEWFVIGQDARYVRYVGHGNSSNTWNSLNEVAFSNVPSTTRIPMLVPTVGYHGSVSSQAMFDMRGRRISREQFRNLSHSPSVLILHTPLRTERSILGID